MKPIEIAVDGGRVAIGPPSLIPLAGSSLHHPVAAMERIFRQRDALDRLRTAWPRLGMHGNAHQMTDAEMRRAIEQAGASKRLVSLYLPRLEEIVIDLAWYEDTGPRRSEPQAAVARQVGGVALPQDDWNISWDKLDKIWSALKRTGPRLRRKGHERIANELEALIQPETVAMTLGMIAALMAAHAYGVGEIADIALIAYAYSVAGTQGVFAIGHIADATIDAASARSSGELDRVADRYAEAFITLGAAFVSGLLTRMTQRAAAKAREPAAAFPDASKTSSLPKTPAVDDLSPARIKRPTALPESLKPLLDKEAVIARQKGLALEKLHALAVENQKRLGELGSAIAQKTGSSFKDPGVKDLARAAEKMANEGYADASGLKDLSRAAFTVRDRAQADAIVAELRKTYPVYDKGWQQLESGYLDRKIILQSPNGGVSEVQLVPETIWDYKVGEGHALYEVARTTDDVALIQTLREESVKKFTELLKGTPFDKGK